MKALIITGAICAVIGAAVTTFVTFIGLGRALGLKPHYPPPADNSSTSILEGDTIFISNINHDDH